MRRFYRLSLTLSLAITLSVVSVGCGGSSTEAGPAPSPAAQTTADAGNPQTSSEKIKFKQADGSEKFSLKFKADGAKLVDGNDTELARLKVDGNKIKIKDAAEQVLGYVVMQDGYWKLESADQKEELYILRLQDDGDLKLEDGSDKPIYKVKVRDYGYEIESPDDTSLYKVKVKEGKISLRDANEETVLSTKSPMMSTAMVPFGFDVLTPPQQAALAYAVNVSGGGQ